MDRPPRALSDSPFSLRAIFPSLWQGLGVAITLVTTYAWLDLRGWSQDLTRTIVMVALLLSVLLIILANRDHARSLFLGFTVPNTWMRRLTIAVVIVLIIVFTTPSLREMLKVVPLSMWEIVVVCIVMIVCILWLELLRFLLPKKPHALRASN